MNVGGRRRHGLTPLMGRNPARELVVPRSLDLLGCAVGGVGVELVLQEQQQFLALLGGELAGFLDDRCNALVHGSILTPRPADFEWRPNSGQAAYPLCRSATGGWVTLSTAHWINGAANSTTGSIVAQAISQDSSQGWRKAGPSPIAWWVAIAVATAVVSPAWITP